MAAERDAAPLTFFDVETTGLSSEDRVVSLGIIHVDDVSSFRTGLTTASATHLIFNPGRKSHPRARSVHGYSDAVLALQEPFSKHAPDLRGYFEHAGLAVAHNASFDRRFILKEFELTGRALHGPEFFCTMLEYRRQNEGRSGLDAVLQHIGMPPRTGHHGALADAWYAMAVYRWLHGMAIPTLEALPTHGPLNLRDKTVHEESVVADKIPEFADKNVSRPTPDARAFAAAVALLSPMATLMMHIAHADGDVHALEVEAISLLMHTTLTGLSHSLTDAQQQDLLSYLVELQPSSEDIEAACLSVVRDANMRNSLSGWVRQVTMADGNPSPAENASILEIADTMRKVRRSLADLK